MTASDPRHHSPPNVRCAASAAAWITIPAVLLALVIGCERPPQMSPEHFRQLEAVRTAVSAKRSDWLESCARQIDQQHAAGKLDDTQYAEFQTIIAQARGGDWPAADKEAIRFENAQRTR